MTQQSRAQQVCSTSEKVHYDAGQMNTLKDAKTFLSGGPQLMFLVEVLFLCFIVQKLDRIEQFALAFMSLMRSSWTKIVLPYSSDHDVLHDMAERCRVQDLYLMSVVTRNEKTRSWVSTSLGRLSSCPAWSYAYSLPLQVFASSTRPTTSMISS
eukprot:8012717-Pyramimonas_sp.AAC.1